MPVKPIRNGQAFSATIRAGVYPAGHPKAGKQIQFRIALETAAEPHAEACLARLLEMRDRLVKAKRGLEAELLLREAAQHLDAPALFEQALMMANVIERLSPGERSKNRSDDTLLAVVHAAVVQAVGAAMANVQRQLGEQLLEMQTAVDTVLVRLESVDLDIKAELRELKAQVAKLSSPGPKGAP